jgi:two-component system sensor histidine kinase/response regulator
MRVLVVDDELGIREGCRRALTARGFEVEVAENGPTALRRLREGSFGVMLVDAMMPGMSGLELIQEARKLSPELICIVITGYATVELAVQAMREGAQDFIAKPFTPEMLHQVIQRELERQRLRQEAKRVKELEEEIERMSRVKAETERRLAVESRFMMTMVHTLRAPVAVLKNSLQLIRQGYVSGEEQPAFLAQAERRAHGLLTLLDDVLLLSRLKERRVGGPPARPVSVAEALHAVLEKISPLAQARGLRITVDLQDRPIMGGEEEHLQALWDHLITNAVRYTAPGGQIRIFLGRDGVQGKIVGVVSDTGIGIAPEEIPRIFEEFYRTEGAKSMEEMGTGLGLPIVQEILSLYGGTLEVDSKPGEGSTFRFLLPLPPSLGTDP